jgi:hypothetical protein
MHVITKKRLFYLVMGQMYAQKGLSDKFLGRMLGNNRKNLGAVLQNIFSTFGLVKKNDFSCYWLPGVLFYGP